MSFRVILWPSVVAVLKLVLLTVAGVLMERWEILNGPIRKSLSKMIFYVFTPCLIFVKIGEGITLDEVSKTWPLLVFPIIYAAISAALSYGALWMLCMQRSDQFITRAFVACNVFINAGNMPFTLIQSIARDVAPFSRDSRSEDKGIAYVAVYVAISSTLLWTAGFQYMQRASREDDLTVQDQANVVPIRNLGEDETYPRRSEEASGITDIMATVRGDFQQMRPIGTALEEMVNPPSRLAILSQIFNPTLLAILAALIVVAVQPIQAALFTDEKEKTPMFAFLTEAADQLGDSAIPLALLLLGGVLYANYTEVKPSQSVVSVPIRMLVVSCVIRLLVMPAIGFALVLPFKGKVIMDNLMTLTILIESGMPAAVNLIVVSGMFHNQRMSKAISRFLLYQYVASCVTSVVLITVALGVII